MKYTIESPKYLFDNIKVGDCFATYHRKWYYALTKLISFIIGEKVSHAMSIIEVDRNEYYVEFTIAEMIAPRKRWETCVIIRNRKDSKDYYKAVGSKFDKNLDLYYVELDRVMTEEQKNKFKEYHLKPKDYKFGEYAITQNWFARFFSNKNKIYSGVCSNDVAAGLREVNITDNKFDDNSPDPVELLKSSFFNKITKIV